MADGRLIETSDGVEIDWTRGLIRATGMGLAPDRGATSLRRSLARQTAVDDGIRKLTDVVSRLRVDGNAFLRDLTAVDDELDAAVQLAQRRSASLELQQTLRRVPNGETLTRAKVRVACIDANTWQPRRIPEQVAALIEGIQ